MDTSPMRFSSSTAATTSNMSSSTPRRFSSPKSRQYIYSDRFIPSRLSTNLDDALLDSIENIDAGSRSVDGNISSAHENQGLMNNLLRSELLGKSSHYHKHNGDSNNVLSTLSSSSPNRTSSNFLKFCSPKRSTLSGASDVSKDSISSHFAPGRSTQKTASASPKKSTRKIPKAPYKVLDAPHLADDYYLNLVDWSSTNTLAVALGASVFLWSAHTSKVTKLCDLESNSGQDSVTSITWAVRGSQIAVGTFSGGIQIWDAATCVKLRDMRSHTSRVGTLAWSSAMIASGSRDRTILVQDVRVRSSYANTPTSHHSQSRSHHSDRRRTSNTNTPGSHRSTSVLGSITAGAGNSSVHSDTGRVSATGVHSTHNSNSSPIHSYRESTDMIDDQDNNDDDDEEEEDGEEKEINDSMNIDQFNNAANNFQMMNEPLTPHPHPSHSNSDVERSSSSSSSSTSQSQLPATATAIVNSYVSPNRYTNTTIFANMNSSNHSNSNSNSNNSRLLSLNDPMSINNTIFPHLGPLLGTPIGSHHSSPLGGISGLTGISPHRSSGLSVTGGLSGSSHMSAMNMSVGDIIGGMSTASPMGFGSGDPCVIQELSCHKQEICGLKWSPEERMLASGGNDNKLYVWQPQASNRAETEPMCRFNDHTAAVKAVAWSPHQHGLLASGGGTADRHIRFWNASTGHPLHRIDTGSQVCNLVWSTTVNEIVSTHGYSLNQIIVWKYPSMQKLATLTGHSMRVLYLAMSPDGQSVVTGAGDETLRFWNVFPGPRSSVGVNLGTSLLYPSNRDIR